MLQLCNSAIDVAAQAAGTAISTELFYVNSNRQWGVALPQYSHKLAGCLREGKGLNPDRSGQGQGSLPLPGNPTKIISQLGSKDK